MDPDRAPVGVQVRSLPEGLLVEGVTVGGGADLAGVQAGDLVVSVDGVEVRKAANTALLGLRGEAGSRVSLVLRGAEGGEYREVEVQRGEAGRLPVPPPLPASVRTLRRALNEKGARAVRRATRAAIADGFGGLQAGEVLGNDLRRAWGRRPAVAVAAAELLQDYAALASTRSDHRLQLELGWLWLRADRPDLAVPWLEQVVATRTPDAWEPGGDFVGEAGGDLGPRRDLARALWQTGQRDQAIDHARALLASWDLPRLAGLVGMAPRESGTVWRGRLAPLAPFSLQTLDGATWSLEAQRGKVVLINFFATWCRPCADELPALAELSRSRQDAGLEVIAVSMDDPRDRDKLPGFVDAMDLPFPVAHAPELGRTFQVDGIPAVRLLDRDGGLLHAGQGYSPEGFVHLVELVDASLAQAVEPGAALGAAWTRGQARLSDFMGVGGVQAVSFVDGELALGRADGPPVVLPGASQGIPPDADGAPGGELLAWLDGPVAAAPGQHWVRALGPTGRARWLFTTRDAVTALASDGERLWVATAGGVLALDGLGRVLHRSDGGATDLAAHPDGGVWVVDGQQRRLLGPDGQELRRDAAAGAVHVDAVGRVASDDFEDILTGRFGPDGALRSALARADGTLVALDGAGQPALTWELAEPPRLAAGDVDGDGQDELLVAIRHQGLATLTLQLP